MQQSEVVGTSDNSLRQWVHQTTVERQGQRKKPEPIQQNKITESMKAQHEFIA